MCRVSVNSVICAQAKAVAKGPKAADIVFCVPLPVYVSPGSVKAKCAGCNVDLWHKPNAQEQGAKIMCTDCGLKEGSLSEAEAKVLITQTRFGDCVTLMDPDDQPSQIPVCTWAELFARPGMETPPSAKSSEDGDFVSIAHFCAANRNIEVLELMLNNWPGSANLFTKARTH